MTLPRAVTAVALVLCTWLVACPAVEQREEWFRYRVPAYGDFRRHYDELYRIAALANYWNFHVYDVLLTEPDPGWVEGPYQATLRDLALGPRIRLDPKPDAAAPRFTRLAGGVAETFMWSHHLHENAFDVYASPEGTMEERRALVERATDHYLTNPRAFAPTEVPMAELEALPSHGAFAEAYPRVNGLLWAGHWVHGGVYDGQLAVIRGEKTRQQVIDEVDQGFRERVASPPAEHPHFTHIAPDFTALHPRAAAIFANMHMLHDRIADILADDAVVDKRAAITAARDRMLAVHRPEEAPEG